ncbi:hypothetical protein P1P68_02360 [Streptomyces scabiei]|uniref:hypothetical protein n=1 Tax=Streptomyces scabiei TaxID=1930 RepID=UPI00299041B8|nr:hypothetical protein [Streptomyces scabiei]MDW8803678.1 hypothetical protein [Streptomyces scabiei]
MEEKVKVAQARQVIGEAVSARVQELFEAEAEHQRARSRRHRELYVSAGLHEPTRSRLHPAYVPERAPEVPTSVVRTRPAATEPGTIFTWKVERDEPPYFIMLVASTWTRQVAHQGYALIDGRPVVHVREWDEQGRPLEIRTVDLCGLFDPTIHGWRAWAHNADRRVDWSQPETPRLVAR